MNRIISQFFENCYALNYRNGVSSFSVGDMIYFEYEENTYFGIIIDFEISSDTVKIKSHDITFYVSPKDIFRKE